MPLAFASVQARRISEIAFAAAFLLAAAASAKPPADADPALAPWFRSLLQPGTEISRCSLADCRETDYRIKADHYEALIGGSG